MLTINDALANKILDCIFNSGAGVSIGDSATLEIRTGASPGANAASSGTVLASVAVPADACAAAAARAIAKSGTWEDTSADATGVAAHFELRSSGGTYVIRGTVTSTGGGGDLTVDNVNFVATQPFTITSFTLSYA